MAYIITTTRFNKVTRLDRRLQLDAALLKAWDHVYQSAESQGRRDTQQAWDALRSLLTYEGILPKVTGCVGYETVAIEKGA